jgi:hypothetical protein
LKVCRDFLVYLGCSFERKWSAALVKYKTPSKLTHGRTISIGWLVGYRTCRRLLVGRQLRLAVNQPREFSLLKAKVLRERTEEAALGSLVVLPGADGLLPDTELLPEFGLGEVVCEALSTQTRSE